MKQAKSVTVRAPVVRVTDYVPRIIAAWKRAFESIIETGHLLNEAKAALPHGEWGQMFDSGLLPFSRRVAQYLMDIADDPRITNHGSYLPPCWRTLAEIVRLNDVDFAAGIKTGVIHPTMTRADVQTFRTWRHYQRQTPRSEINADLGNLIAEGRKFGCVVADPPWPYTAKVDGSAVGHYHTMALDEICALPVRQVAAANCHLFLWTPAPFLEKAFAVMAAWGFTYKSQFVWCKHPPAHGSYWMICHENVLLGVRGSMTSFPAKGIWSWMEIKKGRHSEKPEEVRRMIERVSPDPRLELFGRKMAKGWTVCGDQIGQDDETECVTQPSSRQRRSPAPSA